MGKAQLAYMKRYRAEKRRRLSELKRQKSCTLCGETNPDCLQFHHRDPSTKKDTIARLYAGTWKWEVILAEIEKCDVLCANCHVKHHRQIEKNNRDSVNSPKHYTISRIEIIDVIEEIIADYPTVLGWSLGQVIKYISRGPYKSNMLEDMQKAQWYLDRAVSLANKTDTEEPSDSNGPA